ncbi:MAG: YhfC family intramembrane metalloprotease [Anaerolineae bacterium]|nr:YhfC family intramembrane metalloprotease [Anaerolineae bacterium]
METIPLNPLLIASYVAAIAFEVILPLVVGFFIHRRFGVRWKFFLFGMLVFFVTQLLIRIPLVQLVQAYLGQTIQSSQTFLYAWVFALALTAGLFEEIGRYLGYRFLIKDNKTWEVGLMYGAGHGGLESMLLIGGLVLLGLINYIALSTTDFSALNLPPDQLASIQTARQQYAGLDWWMPLLGAYERFITIFFHIAMSVLVLQTFLRRSLSWLVLAIALHTLVNFIALVLAQLTSVLWVEVALTFTLPLSLALIFYLRPRPAPPGPAPAA